MTAAKIGRPRCKKSREAVLSATHALLEEKSGTGLTIEAIAKRAGVGKPTIYRWWPSLADIVLEALLCQADTNIAMPAFESLHVTLHHFLCLSTQAIVDGSGVHLRFLMAHAQKDKAFRERFRDNFVTKRRAALRAIFLQAVDKGQIDSRHNLEMLVDLIFGTMWYRLLTGHAPLDACFADELTEVVITLVQPKPA